MSFVKKILLLALITLVIYFPSFFNPFIWDDEQFIYNNSYVQNFDLKAIFTQNTVAGAGESSNYFRPLTTLTFAYDYLFWENNVFGYHLVNTLLHISVGLLLSCYLYLLKFSKRGILFVTSIFLLHPLQTEAVTYINSRGDSLYSFFLFLSLISSIFILTGKTVTAAIYDFQVIITTKFWYFFCCLTFIASILSKELGLAGIGLHLLTIGALYYQGISKLVINKHAVRLMLMLLSVIILYGISRLTFWHFDSGYTVDLEASPYYKHLYLRLFTAFKIFFVYLGLIFFPYPLHMERSTEVIYTLFNPWLCIFSLLVSAIIYFVYRFKNKTDAAWLLFGFLWFGGLFTPISGLIPSVGMVYEHWMYLPHIGVSIVTFILISKLTKSRSNLKKILNYIFILILCILCILTMYQNHLWSDKIKFYTYTLKFNQTARLHNNLAMAYAEQNNLDKAIESYKNSLTLGDYYPQVHHNLANAYRDKGMYPEAIESYKNALQQHQGMFPSHYNLIQTYLLTGQTDLAKEHVESMKQLYPDNPDVQTLQKYVLEYENN